jgi:hypothetical protein
MTPINEVPVGKFCRINEYDIGYVCRNNFKDGYTLAPIVGAINKRMKWGKKVYVYKRINQSWVGEAKKWVEFVYKDGNMDNLTYIENLSILKNYLKPVIVKTEE